MTKNIFILFLVLLLTSGCQEVTSDRDTQTESLILASYTVPKEVYQKEIIPAFKKYWKEKTGKNVQIFESYMASGAQSRTIAAGFEADIAALSLEQDINHLQNQGLITHDWKKNKHNGFVTRSVVVLAHRPGNPRNIRDWEDLTRDGIEVIYPSPKTSGGAMWVVNAIYGSGLKTAEILTGQKDSLYASSLLKKIQKRVRVMDKSGRESVTTYENGTGDVLLTYENEALLRQKQGKDFPFIIPEATILIENPVALLDKNIKKHNNRKVAEAFLNFLFTEFSQRAFAAYGFRPVDVNIFQEFKEKYPQPKYLFDISYLGGWEKVNSEIYGPQGIWTTIFTELADEK